MNKRIIPLFHVGEIKKATWQQRNPEGTDADWKLFKQQGKHNSFPNMHSKIAEINWIYFHAEVDGFKIALPGLITALRKHADYVSQHTQFLIKALAWQRHHKQNHYLLIDEERIQAESWLKIRFENEQPPCEPTDLHCEFICESTKNANNLMTQVFLSYSALDKMLMQQIRRILMRQGITVWMSKTDIQTRTEFQEEINQGIEGADNFIYLISPDSAQSKYCQQDLQHATNLNKRIIFLLIRATEPEFIPLPVRKQQFIDFTKYPHETLGIDELLKELNQSAYYYQQHKILLVKALKWDRQNANPSILLRGHTLQHFENWLKVAKTRQQHGTLPLQERFIAESANQPADLIQEVFISYSRANADFARRLNEALQLQGKTTWFDQESIAAGVDFQQEIYRGIENTNNFLFIISPSSIHSPYCLDEVNYAQSLHKRFVTVLYRAVPSAELPLALASVQWLDFNRHDADFYANFSELIRMLDLDREHVHHHTQWAHRANAWIHKEKSVDLLLRSSEFVIADQWLRAAKQQHKNPSPTKLQQEYIQTSQAAIVAEQQRKRRQLVVLRILLSWSVIALIISVLLGWFNYQQKNRTEIALKTAQRTQSLFWSALSQHETRQGNAANGTLLALAALPKAVNHPDRPLLPTAKQALFHAVTQLHEQTVLSGHQGSVNQAVFSPDGTLILTASDDKTARLWQTESGKLLQTLIGHQAKIEQAAFSPDGQWVITVSSDKTARLWPVKSGQLLHTFTGRAGTIYYADFSPDSRLLVTTTWDEEAQDPNARLWDVNSGKLLHVLAGHTRGIRHADFSPDGQYIVTAADDKTARLWEVSNGQLRHIFTGHQDGVARVAFSPDGTQVATVSWDQTVRLWETPSGRLQHILAKHTDVVYRAVFSPNGKLLVTVSNDKTARIWEVATGKQRQVLTGHQAGIARVTFSPDGLLIATTSWDKTLRLWQVNDGQPLAVLAGHEDIIRDIAYHPLGHQIITASNDHTARLWQIKANELPRTLVGHENWLWFAAYSPDGQTVVTTSDDHTARLWQTETGRWLHTLTGHQGEVNQAAFSPDGTYLATAAFDKTARVWETNTGQLRHILVGHQGWVYHVAFSSDGQQIATASGDHTARLWNANDGQLRHILKGHQDEVYRLDFNSAGTRLVTASADHTARLWDSQSGQLLQVLVGHQGKVNQAVFNPDGSQILTAAFDKTARLWDTQTGHLLQVLRGHDDKIYRAQVSPDGLWVVTASADHTAGLWEVASGQLFHQLKGHENEVVSAVFSPNSQQVITASKDNTARLWDVNSGELLFVFEGHTYAVNYATYHPNGRQIVTVSRDKTAKLWPVYSLPTDIQTLIDYANQVVPRQLTTQQRQQFFLESPGD
ncbi:MAG: TIR domain-containing protein [Thioploca sp.]|nr:TIR domain-containing protein [Thioploca sp.]